MAEGPAGVRGTRVLVTGASGFIGSHLTRRLVADGADVHALTSVVSSVWPTRLVGVRDRITLHEASLADRGALHNVVARAQPELVFHLGAYTHVGKSWQRVDECLQVNVQGTVNLLMALGEHGYRRLVNVGTSEIYGDVAVPFREDHQPHPISPYSVSKYAAEEYCRLFAEAYGWPIVRVRPFNAYGPGQSPDRIVPEVITRALRKQRLPLTSGRQTREFNYVEDLASGLVKLATTPGVDGELFNLGCGVDVSIRHLTTMILDLMDNPITPEFGALPDRPTEIWAMRCDAEKAQQKIGYRPQTPLEAGLLRTIEWYRRELATDRSPFALPAS